MPRCKPVLVGGHLFASISELRRFVNASIETGSIDQMIARGLVERHAYAGDVIGAGISEVRVVDNSYGGRSLEVLRIDGSRIIVRRQRCIDESERMRFSDACRQVVFDEIAERRGAMFAGGVATCSLTGVALSSDDCDLDHAPPWTFASIVRAFIIEHGQCATIIKSSSLDVPMMADEAAAARFRAWHRERAVLRPVSRVLNRRAWRLGGASDPVLDKPAEPAL